MEETRTEYHVVWFPHNRPGAKISPPMGNLDVARALFAEKEADGFAPIIEVRQITVTEWKVMP